MAKEIIRVKCPLCGMVSDWWNEYFQKGLKDKEEPFEIKIYRQTLGGKKPSGLYRRLDVPGRKYRMYMPIDKKKRIGKGKAPGKMNYEDITNQEPELVRSIKKSLQKRMKLDEL